MTKPDKDTIEAQANEAPPQANEALPSAKMEAVEKFANAIRKVLIC